MKLKHVFALAIVLSTPLCALAAEAPAAAAFPRREPTPNDTLKSPEVRSDGRVTFRIYAPKASEISVTGDWVSQGLGTGGKLEKDDQGIWSITVGPLPADFYSYIFTVDGVRTIDPKNALIKQGISSLDNRFFLPGKEAAFEENKPGPHGVIRQVWYGSSTLDTQRRMHVYTPPGYDENTERYPVLYLLHGGGDEDSGWSTIGRAGFILDNLLAARKATPMIIVMPNGSLPRSPNAPGAATDPASRTTAQERFTNELMKDVVPLVEKQFRVRTDRESRALAGLSMGGGQTLRVFMSYPDQFGYVAIWSAGLFGQKPDEFESRNSDFLRKAPQVNRDVKLLSISVGSQDFALAGSRTLSEVLGKNGFEHELRISAGGHTWINWRQYLNDLAPRLFH